MIDYFMVPFAAPDDQQAQAGVADAVNQPGLSAISQAPHHFELHLLGEIDDNGTIFPKKELVCDCSALVRPRRETTESSARKPPDSPRIPETGIIGLGNTSNAGS